MAAEKKTKAKTKTKISVNMPKRGVVIESDESLDRTMVVFEKLLEKLRDDSWD